MIPPMFNKDPQIQQYTEFFKDIVAQTNDVAQIIRENEKMGQQEPEVVTYKDLKDENLFVFKTFAEVIEFLAKIYK